MNKNVLNKFCDCDNKKAFGSLPFLFCPSWITGFATVQGAVPRIVPRITRSSSLEESSKQLFRQSMTSSVLIVGINRQIINFYLVFFTLCIKQ